MRPLQGHCQAQQPGLQAPQECLALWVAVPYMDGQHTAAGWDVWWLSHELPDCMHCWPLHAAESCKFAGLQFEQSCSLTVALPLPTG